MSKLWNVEEDVERAVDLEPQSEPHTEGQVWKTKVTLKVQKEGILKSSEKILKEKMKIQQLQS